MITRATPAGNRSVSPLAGAPEGVQLAALVQNPEALPSQVLLAASALEAKAKAHASAARNPPHLAQFQRNIGPLLTLVVFSKWFIAPLTQGRTGQGYTGSDSNT